MTDEAPKDEVSEAFWNRYSHGDPNWRPPIIDNAEGRLQVMEYVLEMENQNERALEKIANRRFH